MKQLSFLIKPASSLCNMRCRYCFYADVSDHRSVKSYGVMEEETVRALFARVAEEAPDEVTFAFQGGEPTVAGLAFFKNFCSLARECLPDVEKIHYSLQTNGLLIDDAFAAFLKEEGFLVGLSLDGYRENHNFLRKKADGKDSYTEVMAAYRRLMQYGVDCNILTVVTAPLAKRATKLWQFYQKNKLEFVQLIPCLDDFDATSREAFALTPHLYGAFLKELFPHWVDALVKGEYISVRLFDNLVRQASGEMPEMCGMCGRCSPQLVVEADGSVYPCDFYVLDEWCCGNLRDNSVKEILSHPNMQRFLVPLVSDACKNCRFFHFCRGGCKRYRALYLAKTGYCPYADFLASVERDLTRACRFVFGRR
ncbi:MAG: SPASM domain-containing protein [Clostridia bacterium]|nr:SPASM domain-containing protein [Clostridia bacterium]